MENNFNQLVAETLNRLTLDVTKKINEPEAKTKEKREEQEKEKAKAIKSLKSFVRDFDQAEQIEVNQIPVLILEARTLGNKLPGINSLEEIFKTTTLKKVAAKSSE